MGPPSSVFPTQRNCPNNRACPGSNSPMNLTLPTFVVVGIGLSDVRVGNGGNIGGPGSLGLGPHTPKFTGFVYLGL